MRPEPVIYDPPADEGLTILHRDDHMLVLSKPSGLLSVPGRDLAHKDCLERRAKTAFPESLLVHRLDRGTSGVFVMAMKKRAQVSLSKQFENRRIRKTYIAIVHGLVKEDTGEIDLPLICDWPNRPMQKVCYETGKESKTRWEVLERDAATNTTRLRLFPETGRSHQLRVHLKEIGHPILGDALYAPLEIAENTARLLLHAESLNLHHPDGGKRITFTDPCDF